VQRPALDLSGRARHDAAFHHFEDNVAFAGAPVALLGAGVIAAAQAFQPAGRVLEPAHAADVAVEARVAVSDDVEARPFLIADEGADGVGVLFAEAGVSKGVAKGALPEIFRIPHWTRQGPRDRRGKY
jgi:hypothetical protein